jgi:adenylate cyclase
MADIFISYASVDRPFARRLADALGAHGWSVWWDHNNLRGGEQFEDIIQEAICNARVVIVVWSKNSIKSRWVRDEATLAQEKNKLVPLRIDIARPPLGFRSIHTIDLSSWAGEDEAEPFDRLVEDLRARFESVRALRSPLHIPLVRYLCHCRTHELCCKFASMHAELTLSSHLH